jgi:cholesterol transport system auxiliary component
MKSFSFFRLHSSRRIARSCATPFCALLVAAGLLSGCTVLQPADVKQPTLYSLDLEQAATDRAPHVQAVKPGAPTLVLGTPHAAAGFDGPQMVYVRQPHRLEYFRDNQWVNSPADMLPPLAATSIERSGAFSAVLQSPTSVRGQYRLDLSVIRLQQEFFSVPSREHFTLRAHLLRTATHEVVASREFDVVVPAPSDDPYGGVIAANQAVRTVLTELAEFCADAVARQPPNKP